MSELFEGHRHLVRAIARKLPVPPQEREDLEAEGMLILLQAIRDYDPGQGTWFSTFATARLHGGLRQVVRREQRWRQPHRLLPRHELDPGATSDEREVEAVLDPRPTVEQAALASWQRDAIRRAVRKLPEPWQRVIRLRFQYEQTYAECAHRLGRSVPTVREYERKAFERLRGLLHGVLE